MFRIHAHLNYSNVKSPSLIPTNFSQKLTENHTENCRKNEADKNHAQPSQTGDGGFSSCCNIMSHPVYTPICPTKPQVPIPEETAGPFICNLKIQVAIGPVMAEAKVGGIQILDFYRCYPSEAYWFRYPVPPVHPIGFL